MGCCQSQPPQYIEFPDGDGNMHKITLLQKRLIYAPDGGTPVPITVLKCKPRTGGAEIRGDHLPWSTVNQKQWLQLQDWCRFTGCSLEEVKPEMPKMPPVPVEPETEYAMQKRGVRFASKDEEFQFNTRSIIIPAEKRGEGELARTETQQSQKSALSKPDVYPKQELFSPEVRKDSDKTDSNKENAKSPKIKVVGTDAKTRDVDLEDPCKPGCFAEPEPKPNLNSLKAEAVVCATPEGDVAALAPNATYAEGDRVSVYSVSRKRWIQAQVASVTDDHVTVTYVVPDGAKEKILHKDHEHLSPNLDTDETDDVWTVMKKYTMYMDESSILGEGSSSICRRGYDNEAGKELAIKVYKITPDYADECGFAGSEAQKHWESITMKKYLRQVEVLRNLQKPLVPTGSQELWNDQMQGVPPEALFMQLVDYSKDHDGNPAVDPDDGLLYVITEKAEYSLLDYLNGRKAKGENLSAEEIKLVANSMCMIVAGLHTKEYVHLDLKPENMMIFDGALKLIDMDGCMEIGAKVSLLDPSLSCSPVYCSPEWAKFCLDESDEPLVETKPGLDAWSVGAAICELQTLEPMLLGTYVKLFSSPSDVPSAFMAWLANQKVAPLPDVVREKNPELADFLEETLLVCDPTKRKTVAEALGHRYFNGLRSDESKSPKAAALLDAETARIRESLDHRILNAGNVNMLKVHGTPDPKDDSQWERAWLRLTRSASVACQLSGSTKLLVAEGVYFYRAKLTVVDLTNKILEWRWKGQSGDLEKLIIRCDNDEDMRSWVLAMKALKVLKKQNKRDSVESLDVKRRPPMETNLSLRAKRMSVRKRTPAME